GLPIRVVGGPADAAAEASVTVPAEGVIPGADGWRAQEACLVSSSAEGPERRGAERGDVVRVDAREVRRLRPRDVGGLREDLDPWGGLQDGRPVGLVDR